MFYNWYRIWWSRNQLWSRTHFRHPTDEQLRQLDIYRSRTYDRGLSSSNWKWAIKVILVFFVYIFTKLSIRACVVLPVVSTSRPTENLKWWLHKYSWYKFNFFSRKKLCGLKDLDETNLIAENHSSLRQTLRELWEVKAKIVASPGKLPSPYFFSKIEILGKPFFSGKNSVLLGKQLKDCLLLVHIWVKKRRNFSEQDSILKQAGSSIGRCESLHKSVMTAATSCKTCLHAIIISRCQSDNIPVAFQPMGIFRFWRNGEFTFFQRCLQPLYLSRSSPPTQSNLPFVLSSSSLAILSADATVEKNTRN